VSPGSLQSDLDLLVRFRQREGEYGRERRSATSPFRWIDRNAERGDDPLSELPVSWGGYVDVDDEDDDEARERNSQTATARRMLVRYRPRQIQPTKLAEDLARNYKKWQADMTLKVEAKKAEAKRRGNKHDLVGPPNPSSSPRKGGGAARKAHLRKTLDSPRQGRSDRSTPTSDSPRLSRPSSSSSSRMEVQSPRRAGRDKAAKDKAETVRSTQPANGKGTTTASSTTPHRWGLLRRGSSLRQLEDEEGSGGVRQKNRDQAKPSSSSTGTSGERKANPSALTGSVAPRERGGNRERGGEEGAERCRAKHLRASVLTDNSRNDEGDDCSQRPKAPARAKSADIMGQLLDSSDSELVVDGREKKEEEEKKEKEEKEPPSLLTSIKLVANKGKMLSRSKSSTANDVLMQNGRSSAKEESLSEVKRERSSSSSDRSEEKGEKGGKGKRKGKDKTKENEGKEKMSHQPTQPKPSQT